MLPVTVVKGKEEVKVVHSPDLKGWLASGWKIKEDKPKKEAKKPAESALDL